MSIFARYRCVILLSWMVGVGLSACAPASGDLQLRAERDDAAGTITVYRGKSMEPLLTQNAAPDFRPFLHPVVTPDGQSEVTQFSPDHHRHQTGLYWGFTRLNVRDYFHHPEGDYWRRDTLRVLEPAGAVVRWETVYELLDSTGAALVDARGRRRLFAGP